MRHLILISSLALMSLVQTANNTAVGSWSAELKGQPFVRLELRSEEGKLTGTLAIGDIHVDAKGDVDQAGPLPSEQLPISDLSQQGSVVAFSRKDGDDTDRFEFRVVDSSSGELRFLLSDEQRADLAANGIPVPKPIPLTRQPASK